MIFKVNLKYHSSFWAFYCLAQFWWDDQRTLFSLHNEMVFHIRVSQFYRILVPFSDILESILPRSQSLPKTLLHVWPYLSTNKGNSQTRRRSLFPDTFINDSLRLFIYMTLIRWFPELSIKLDMKAQIQDIMISQEGFLA